MFAFLAKVTNLNGWRMWLNGKAVVVDVDSETYMLKDSDLPWKELVNELDTKWKLIFWKTVEAQDW